MHRIVWLIFVLVLMPVLGSPSAAADDTATCFSRGTEDYKRHRLYAALLEKQNTDRCANNVLGGVGNFGSSSRI